MRAREEAGGLGEAARMEYKNPVDQSYVCLICYRSLLSPEEGCPYCKSKTLGTVGASPLTLAFLSVIMAVLLSATGYLASSFHGYERQRGERHAERAARFAVDGDYARAADEYREALTYSRDNFTYRLNLTVVLYEAGRLEEAETYLHELQATDPTAAMPNLYLAQIAAERGEVDEAATHYRAAIYGQWPRDPVQRRVETRFALVSLLESHGRRLQAVAELLELRQELPDNRQVASRVAWSLLQTGAPRRALDIFEELVETDDGDAVAHSGLAEAEFALDHYLTARTHFRRALSLDRRLTHLEARLTLCDEIIALDPTIRGLGRISRFDRSLQMLDRTLDLLDTCSQVPGDGVGPVRLSPATHAARETARRWIGRLESRPQDDDSVAENLDLVDALWRSEEFCDTPEDEDPALARVVRKLSTT